MTCSLKKLLFGDEDLILVGIAGKIEEVAEVSNLCEGSITFD